MKQPKLRLPVFLNSPTNFLDEVNFVDTFRHYLVYHEKELNAISNVSQNLIVSVNIASLRQCCWTTRENMWDSGERLTTKRAAIFISELHPSNIFCCSHSIKSSTYSKRKELMFKWKQNSPRHVVVDVIFHTQPDPLIILPNSLSNICFLWSCNLLPVFLVSLSGMLTLHF